MDFILIYWGSFCKELDFGQDLLHSIAMKHIILKFGF